MIADQVKIGIPIEEALDTSSRQIGLEDFRFFAVTVLLQYSTGGNIASTLDMLSTIIRKRRATRMKATCGHGGNPADRLCARIAAVRDGGRCFCCYSRAISRRCSAIRAGT